MATPEAQDAPLFRSLGSRETLSKADWLRIRKQGLFSTDGPSVLGFNRWRSAVDVYADKLSDEVTEISNDSMKDGLDLEPFCMKRFEERTGLSATPFTGVLVRNDLPWLGASLDCITKDGDEHLGLELKTTGDRGYAEWEEGPPTYYHAQVMQQLAVTGFRASYIQVWSYGKPTRIFLIERDEKIIEWMINELGRFWHEHVCRGIAPTGSLSSSADYRKLFPNAIKSTIELPREYLPLLEKWDEAKELERRAEALKEEVKLSLMPALGENEAGSLGNRKVRWLPMTRRTIDAERLEREQPEIFNQYKRETQSRRFEIR